MNIKTKNMPTRYNTFLAHKTFLLQLCLLFGSLYIQAQSKRYQFQSIMYPVFDEYTHENLFGVQVLCYAEGKTVPDTLQTGGNMMNGERVSGFCLFNYKEGKYRFVLTHSGYEDYDFTANIKYYNRESNRTEKPIYLKRKQKERKLGEVKVNATLVKFYTNKDTLVYNADAFLTAEGSMLDGLIRQLPGVELKDDGRIYVNGEFVESLLLNGDDFFKHDKRIMLENLPAYMVKNIKVYKREQDAMLRMMGVENGHKSLVMDVNLKKQYAIGWIANTEWGAGTKDRYLGRLFANRFSPSSRITLIGNLNNVNDSRKPGEAGGWTPVSMPSGTLTTKSAQLEYKFKKKDGKYDVGGNVEAKHTKGNNATETHTENFLQGGNTYERLRYEERSRNTDLSTHHSWMQKLNDRLTFHLSPGVRYGRSKENSSSAGGAFSDDPTKYVTRGLIDSLYRPMAGSVLRPILMNRSLRSYTFESESWLAFGGTGIGYKIPHTTDYLRVTVNGSGGNSNSKQFRHQLFNKPADVDRPTDFRNEYLDMQSKNYAYSANAEYRLDWGFGWSFNFGYTLASDYSGYDRGLFRLDEMEGWGEGTEHGLGALPSVTDWQDQTRDVNNSYDYGRYTYKHEPYINWSYQFYKGGKKLEWECKLPLNYHYRKLYYHKNGETFNPTQRSLLPQPDMRLMYATKEWTYTYELTYKMTSTQPSINYLVETMDDSNPLYISYGNSDLADRYVHTTGFRFTWNNKAKERLLNVGVTHNYTQNAVAMYTEYDRHTGVRKTRPENINGNYMLGGRVDYSTPLDKQRYVTLRTNTSADYYHSVDLTESGETGIGPRSTVGSLYLTEELNVDYRFRKYKVGARLKGTYGQVKSDRRDFERLNVGDVVYGLTGQAELPWKLQLSTDLNLYSRYGYSDAAMNTNDVVWNARLSRSILKGNLVLMLDGYDILGQLSNVTRTVNAQGRVERYRNVIPRYVMLHAIYRLNIKPKKRPGDA